MWFTFKKKVLNVVHHDVCQMRVGKKNSFLLILRRSVRIDSRKHAAPSSGIAAEPSKAGLQIISRAAFRHAETATALPKKPAETDGDARPA